MVEFQSGNLLTFSSRFHLVLSPLVFSYGLPTEDFPHQNTPILNERKKACEKLISLLTGFFLFYYSALKVS